MDRPTKEQVDEALRRSKISVDAGWVSADGSDGTSDAVLAAEVLALREELTASEEEFRAPLRAELSECRDRLQTILDEAFGPFETMSNDSLLTLLEVKLFEQRRNLQLFRDASEAAELRIVELRKELNADVIVRAMHHPDGRFEIRMSTDEQAENERMQESIDLYRGTIARIEALPDKWLADVMHQRESVADCAMDVERALKGTP
jgi:hypothetical protein